MAIAWFIVPYKRRPNERHPTRYCAIDDYTPEIYAAGGAWTETEVLGNRAIVKVRATDAQITALAGVYKRIPLSRLADLLSTLAPAQRGAIYNELIDMGYTADEIRATLGSDLSLRTLLQVFRFIASRRHKPRYDAPTDTIICDGPAQTCRTIENVDGEIG